MKKLILAAMLFLATAANANEERVAIVVGTQAILHSEITQKAQDLMLVAQARGQVISPEFAKKRAIDALIIERIGAQILARSGLNINDEMIDEILLNSAKNAGFNSLDALKKAVGDYRYHAMRLDVITSEGMSALMQGQAQHLLNINARDVDLFLKSEAGKRALTLYRTTHIRVPYLGNEATHQNQAVASAQIIARALESGKAPHDAIKSANHTGADGGDMGYHQLSEMPEGLEGIIANLAIGGVAVVPHQEGVDVIQLTDKKPFSSTQTRYKTRHILVKTKAQADTILATLTPQNFAQTAQALSQDTGSAMLGGDLGWVVAGQMVAPFENAMINTPAGKISAPVQSQFGWHLVYVEAVQSVDDTASRARQKAYEHLYSQTADLVADDWLDTLKRQSYVHFND